MVSAGCPIPEVLSNWAVGKVSSDELESIAAHLVSCISCQARMLELDSRGDELVEHVRKSNGSVPKLDPQLERMLRNLAENTAVIPQSGSATPQATEQLGDYRVMEVLGEGGMGIVYRAEDVKLRRPVALKKMKPASAENDGARERFLREARAMGAVTHEHVATIYQVGEHNGVPYLAMEFLAGETLEGRITRECKQQGSLMSLAEILRIGRQTAEGLAAAHERGLTHRDIKPSNIWLRAGDGCVKVLDFGLARAENEDVRLTQAGMVVGTPAYMSPEQANGKPTDGRADLFSLGCVLYLMCTGITPFQRSSVIDTLMAVTMEQPQPASDVNPQVPADVARLIQQMLAKDPNERPLSARAVREALDELIRRHGFSNTGSMAVIRPVSKTTARPNSSKRVLALVGIILVIAAVLGGFQLLRLKTNHPATEGRLVVLNVPAGAEVQLDGQTLKDVGQRVEQPLTPGRHSLRISRAGYVEHAEEIDVHSGETLERTADLHRPPLLMPDKTWFEQTARWKPVPADASPQVLRVGKKLAELNPGFDPDLKQHTNYKFNVKDAPPYYIVVLEINTDSVTNLAPVAALTKLRNLKCKGSAPGKGKLYDLSPIKDMKLLSLLDCRNNAIDDFTVLRDSSILWLWCDEPEKHMQELQQIKTLRQINGEPVPWKSAEKD